MAEKFFSEKNIRWFLYDVFDVEALTKYEYFQDHSRETFDMIIDTAAKMATDIMYPVFNEMDQQEPVFDNGEVKVHPVVKQFLRECGSGGWINAPFPYEHGGQQIPGIINMAKEYIWTAANFPLQAYPGLITGAAGLIVSFGIPEQHEAYLEKMFSGEWQGTMALTEPDAGSSLSDIKTTAVPTDKGYYKITGSKIFISCGRHDAVENVIHLMLVKIKGAPPGAKGISLFIVPQERIGENGELEFNDVKCAGIDHKMGYKGSPITQLSMGDDDDCRGYLVGEENKGLRYMFQMMNEARIGVGAAATGIMSAAYYASLEYARERPQGRNIQEKNPETPQVNIIEHADIKRMLLFQRAVSEGALSLIFELSICLDRYHYGEEDQKEKNYLLLELLTPIVKSYSSEMSILSTSAAVQCLGGYGYCNDFPVEQYFRDTRIHPIHEGTTGIQGMDLLGRKVIISEGKAFKYWIDEVNKSIETGKASSDLKLYAEKLEGALNNVQKVTSHLTAIAMKGEIEIFLSDATLYLEFFGLVCIAWQWLIQAIAAEKGLKNDPSPEDKNFFEGKILTFRYFFNYELPKASGLEETLMKIENVTIDMKEEFFED